MITLFGATGYTGQLVAQALERAGLPYRIAGRSAEKLARLSAKLESHPACLVADVTRPSSLTALFAQTQLLINCAGPFTDLGERVISQAALSGVHYLDTTNELGFVFRSRSYDAIAQRTGAALVPACAFEVAFADCMAERLADTIRRAQTDKATRSTAAGAALLDSVDVFYHTQGGVSSTGTRRSAIRSLATSWITYQNGAWSGQMPGARVRTFVLQDEKKSYAFLFPSCESMTVPGHVSTHQVKVWMSASPLVRIWGPVFLPLLARLSRSILRGLILRIAGSGGVSASSESQHASHEHTTFLIQVEAQRGKRKAMMTLQGHDPYALTAEIITYAARQMTQPGYARKGLIAPAQAFDAQTFLDYAQAHWQITCTASSAS